MVSHNVRLQREGQRPTYYAGLGDKQARRWSQGARSAGWYSYVDIRSVFPVRPFVLCSISVLLLGADTEP
jgi:hypothetical protein